MTEASKKDQSRFILLTRTKTNLPRESTKLGGVGARGQWVGRGVHRILSQQESKATEEKREKGGYLERTK